MKRIIWRRIGQQPTFRKLAASFDSGLYALDNTGQLLVNRNFGLDGAWQPVHSLPPDVRNLACAAGVLYYQTADRHLWYLNLDHTAATHVRAGQPWAAAVIAGTEDITLDFSTLWALNDDRSLWLNLASGADGEWRRIGLPHSAARIAAAHDVLFAQNMDGSFWMNAAGGADRAWEHIGAADQAVEITAASEGQSSAIQLYALHRDASLWQGVIVSDCRVSLTTQDAYPVSNPDTDWSSLVDLEELGVTTDVWTINGGALEVNSGDTPEVFLGYTFDQIWLRLGRYLDNHPELDPAPEDIVILDMEAPMPLSALGNPENIHRQDAIVEAYRKRIRVARKKLPQAKLALYGVIVPDRQAQEHTDVFFNRMQGYQYAANSGLFDEVDFLCPVLYTQWGPADSCEPGGLKRYCSIAARIRLGINKTAALSSKPLVPLLSLKVFHEASANYRQTLPVEVARSQLAYLQSRPEVARVVYWAPPNPANPNGIYSSPDEIRLFFCRLNPCHC